MKSLIVEDDFTCRVLLQELLAPYGPVHIAVNGSEAMEACKQFKYDLICLDLEMPGFDGHAVLKSIRRIEGIQGVRPGEGIKIFITSGKTDVVNVKSAFHNMCDEFLPKPVDPDILRRRLEENHLIPKNRGQA